MPYAVAAVSARKQWRVESEQLASSGGSPEWSLPIVAREPDFLGNVGQSSASLAVRRVY